MPPRYGAGHAVTSGVSLRCHELGHLRAELRARADPELAIGAREVRFDRLRAQEEGGRDLSVRQSPRCELGHAALACGELRSGSPPQAETLELRACALRPQLRADALEDRQRLLERLLRLPTPARAALDRAFHQQRSCALER